MKRVLTIIFLAGFITFSASSQPMKTDSITKYMELAAKSNPALLQKYYEYQAALQKVPQVGALPDPDLSVGVFLGTMELMNGNQIADIRLMQMFPWYGSLKAAKDEMTLMAKAKYEAMQEAKLQLFYDVQQTWYELYKIQQNINTIQKNIELLNTLEKLSLAKFKSGNAINSSSSSSNPMPAQNIQSSSSSSSGMQNMGDNNNTSTQTTAVASPMPDNSMNTQQGSGLTDVYRIKIEINELKNNIELLKNQKQTITARFNTYLNRSLQTEVYVPDSLKQDSTVLNLAVQKDSSLKNYPMLTMLQYDQQAIDARKIMITKMSYPMIGFGVNYSLINKNPMTPSSMNGNDMIMPMVNMTLPIYRKKFKAMQTEADFLKKANIQQYSAAYNSLQNEYYSALQSLNNAAQNLNLYKEQLQLIEKTYSIMLKTYIASGNNLTDLLRLRQQTFDYEIKQKEAVADYNIAAAKLKQLINKL